MACFLSFASPPWVEFFSVRYLKSKVERPKSALQIAMPRLRRDSQWQFKVLVGGGGTRLTDGGQAPPLPVPKDEGLKAKVRRSDCRATNPGMGIVEVHGIM